MVRLKSVRPFFRQHDSADCGPTCLKMVAKYYGKDFSLDFLRRICFQDKDGVSIGNLGLAAEKIGFEILQLEVNIGEYHNDIPLPSILYWQSNHFVVLYSVKTTKSGRIRYFEIADPRSGIIKLKPEIFYSNWLINTERGTGYALILEPSEKFKDGVTEEVKRNKKLTDLSFILSYFLKFKKYYLQLAAGLMTASLISLTLPFLTQAIVDIGITTKDHKLILLILLSQLSIVLGSTFVDFIKRQLLIHISSRMNISIVSDFLLKLMNLEISFFESKNIGDIINRVQDQKRIESFISGSVLNIFFVILNYLVLSCVLSIFSLKIFLIFQLGFILSFVWTRLYMKKRRAMDYQVFHALSNNNDSLQEIVNGMQEIKLNAFEKFKREEWQNSQIELFEISKKNLQLEQKQLIGSILINQFKNITITFLAASAVIDDTMTLGMMLSISMISGQLSSPVEEIINFFKVKQQASISIERMNEVYEKPDENELHVNFLEKHINRTKEKAVNFNNNGFEETLEFKDVSFGYNSSEETLIFRNVSLKIPLGKTTAIVGKSGGGKTTLLKLLLKFYDPTKGEILYRGKNLREISATEWRAKCGSVMQEGYIFNNSIARNIATSDETIDYSKLEKCAKAACIFDFVMSLPNGFDTKIGRNGVGISTGQKQRIMIARALYKDPLIVLLDEATSSLDSENEHKIVNNITSILNGKTAIVIAHRLSTVRNADQIIVIENGEVVEVGNHKDLISNRSVYFELVKNQLELNN